MHGTILAYHLVDRRFDFGFTRITPRQFARQINWLSQHGYRGAPVKEFIQQTGDHEKRGKCVAITFDDGYASLLDYAAPVLNHHGFRGSLFVVTDYAGKENRWDVNLFWRRFRHLSWSELRSLSHQGWEIGSHSRTHSYLSDLDDARLWREVWESKTEIEQRLGMPVYTFSLPFGRGDQRVYKAIRKAGYRAVLTLGQTWKTDSELIVLSRRGVYRFDTLRAFHRKLAIQDDDRWQKCRQAMISSFSMGSVVAKRFLPTREKS